MNSQDILILIQYIDLSKLNDKNKKFIEKMKKIAEKGGYITAPQQSFIRDLYGQSMGGGIYQKKQYV